VSTIHDSGSIQDPYYTTGAFHEHSSGAADAAFKVAQLVRLLRTQSEHHVPRLRRIADVGCGAGATTVELATALRGFGVDMVDGYDLHPGINELPDRENVCFQRVDFATVDVIPYDLVVLFDVVEHVPDPIGFLRSAGARGRLVALHFPLDKSMFNGLRGEWRKKLKQPGHLICLDIPGALSVAAMAGLRSIDYLTTPVFRAPSGALTRNQKLLNPVRRTLYAVSPYLLQATLGGVGLMLLARSLLGMQPEGR